MIGNVTYAFQVAATNGVGVTQFFSEPRFTTFRITGNGSVSASAEPDRISKKRVNFSRSLPLLMLTEPRYIFRYHTASFYKRACSSEFWIEHTNIGRDCCQESTKIWHSIVFECCLAHGFRGERAAGMCLS
jgi:hypothetical protein